MLINCDIKISGLVVFCGFFLFLGDLVMCHLELCLAGSILDDDDDDLCVWLSSNVTVSPKMSVILIALAHSKRESPKYRED